MVPNWDVGCGLTIILQYGHGKVMDFCHKNFVATPYCDPTGAGISAKPGCTVYHTLKCSKILRVSNLPLFCPIHFLSPPVHIARWAHMHRFLSVCLSVRLSVCHWIIIHISKSIIAMNLKLCHSIKPS